MEYTGTVLQSDVTIQKLMTLHYYDYDAHFFYPGESHDFWEIIYVDNGSIHLGIDAKIHTLSRGAFVLVRPMSFHTLWGVPSSSSNLMVISFQSDCPLLSGISNQSLQAGPLEVNCMGRILKEARLAFSSALEREKLSRLERHQSSPFGCEQSIQISLELLLIEIIRDNQLFKQPKAAVSPMHSAKDQKCLSGILLYLSQNMHRKLTLHTICQENYLSIPALQRLFRTYLDSGVMEYYARMKIRTSQTMLRSGEYTITEIAEKLGYNSIHYFSECFKKQIGLSPSGYMSSVKEKNEIAWDIDNSVFSHIELL